MRCLRVGEGGSEQGDKRRRVMLGRAWTESDGAAGNSCSLEHSHAHTHTHTPMRLVTVQKNSKLDIFNKERMIKPPPFWPKNGQRGGNLDLIAQLLSASSVSHACLRDVACGRACGGLSREVSAQKRRRRCP